MILIALVLGVGVAALTTVAIGYGQRKWAGWGLLGMLALTLFCVPVLASPFLLFQSLLLLVVMVLGGLLPIRPKHLIGACWVASAVAVAMAVGMGYSEVSQIRQLRRQYPFVLIAPRLDYELRDLERGVRITATEAKNARPIVLADEVEKQLVRSESYFGSDYRTYQLKALHNAQYEFFIASAGFGIGRMRPVRENGLNLREERLPVDGEAAKRTFVGGKVGSEQPLSLEAEIDPPGGPGDMTRDVFAPSAEEVRLDFLNPERFGYVKDGKVAGFESHRVIRFPDFDSAYGMSEAWQLARLELVSLLKFAEPAVYLSDELPNMERLANIPTRPLNEFEREALDKLRTEQDLVVRYSANTIRMLGSLRAGKTCLECHSVQRGALLGAFSYELRRTTPIPVPVSPPDKAKPEA